MIAIDTPVLVDLLADGPNADAAELCLRRCLSSGPVVVCDVVLAELCSALKDGSEALGVLEEMSIRFHPLEAKSALRAGGAGFPDRRARVAAMQWPDHPRRRLLPRLLQGPEADRARALTLLRAGNRTCDIAVAAWQRAVAASAAITQGDVS